MKTCPIYLIHGYTASSKSNWFPWLKEQLQRDGLEIIIPDMPNSNDPHFLPWLKKMQDVIEEVNENTIFIGHSLGSIAALRFILQKEITIKGVILVSGFMDENPMEIQTEGLSEFVDEDVDVKKLKSLIPIRVAITAVDDDIVPTEATKKMADKLDTKLIELTGGGHFIDRDGVTEFPALLDILKRLFLE